MEMMRVLSLDSYSLSSSPYILRKNANTTAYLSMSGRPRADAGVRQPLRSGKESNPTWTKNAEDEEVRRRREDTANKRGNSTRVVSQLTCCQAETTFRQHFCSLRVARVTACYYPLHAVMSQQESYFIT